MGNKLRAHGTAAAGVQAWVFAHLIACVESQHADAAAIRQLPGFGALDEPDLRVSEATAETAWRLATTLTHDEAIGVHVAESLPRGTLDLVEYAFRSSASVRAGLERLAHYGRVLSDRAAVRMEASSGGLLLIVRDVGTSALHPGRAEFALALALKLARDATGVEFAPLQVSFAHGRPGDISEHRRFFRGPVQFAAGSNVMVLSAIDAARLLRGADAALSAIVQRRLDRVLTDRMRPEAASLGDRVRRMLVDDLGQKTITVDGVANALAMSRRTLTRRLGQEGTSFRAVFDNVRSEFARALLQDKSLSVADVAFFLQYSEPAAFHRSFRRWTGLTPYAYRTASPECQPSAGDSA
jgi:AraC-like DNA-binding protein